MFLITPDKKILRNPSDLKLYIAKSGAVVDEHEHHDHPNGLTGEQIDKKSPKKPRQRHC